MLKKNPDKEMMITLLGRELYDVWDEVCASIENLYAMDCLWNNGGKTWTYEYKYRRGGKTLCALYARDTQIGFMIIFGKNERIKFEQERDKYSIKVQFIYDEAKTYHDGKWMMFDLKNKEDIPELIKLLAIKRKPNKK